MELKGFGAATINFEQIRKVVEVLRALPPDNAVLTFSESADMYPEVGDPHAIDFFFLSSAFNYGFWYGDRNGYREPLFGEIAAKRLKGSDLLYRSLMRAFRADRSVLSPKFLADVTPAQFARMFSDDHGPIPFPDLETRFGIARAYGQWFLDNHVTPAQMVVRANESSRPLQWFIASTAEVPGYDQDHPFDKKNMLLAMALANRPEHFLKVTDHSHWQPLIDYHVLRVLLRLGIINLSSDAEETNKAREWADAPDEEAIREHAFIANLVLVQDSQQSMAMVDKALWMARRYCPELEKPQCEKCIFNLVCAKKIDLFQPVFRTTAY